MGKIIVQDQHLTGGAEIKNAAGTTLVSADGVETIVDDAVDSDAIATDAVDSDEIAAGAVETAELGAKAVTAAKVALTEGAILRGAVGGAAEEVAKGSADQILSMDSAGGFPGYYSVSGDMTQSLGVFAAATFLKRDNVMTGLMGTVAEFSFPFNTIVETEAAAAFAKIDDGGSFANLADSAGEGGYTGAYQLFPDVEVENDAAYFGAVAAFGVLNFNVSATVGVYNADSIAWEYWNGSAWSALTIVYDETDTTAQDGLRPFQQDGSIIFNAPGDWVSTTVDAQSAFWVRARCNATVDITTIPLLDAQEHKLVSSPTATEMPANGTIGRGRLNWATVSGANNDTKVILCNLTGGKCSAITTLGKTLGSHEVADWAVPCKKDDQIALYITQEDGTTEFANGIMELRVIKS